MNTDSNDNGDLLLIVAIVGCHYSLLIFCFLSKTEKKRTDERTYGRRKRERKREREKERERERAARDGGSQWAARAFGALVVLERVVGGEAPPR